MRLASAQGPLADLREIPWGTPDADELLRLLGAAHSRAALDAAAAKGDLRRLINDHLRTASPIAFRELLALSERPQAVRHVLRGVPDWSCAAIWDVHRAFTEAFGDPESQAALARLAGVDIAGVDRDQQPEAVWNEIMNRAAARDRLEALIDTALADTAIEAHHAALEAVKDRPWRVDLAPNGLAPPSLPGQIEPTSSPPSAPESSPPPPPQQPPAPKPAASQPPEEPRGAETPDRDLEDWIAKDPDPSTPSARSASRVSQRLPQSEISPPRPAQQPRTGLFLGLVAALAATLLASLAALLWARPTEPERLAIVGSLAVKGAEGRLVLTSAGREVQAIAAERTFAFDKQPLDVDQDGLVDEAWAVHLARTDRACPHAVMPLDRGAPSSQRWSLPTASADLAGGRCRIAVAGLRGLTPGAVVELDAGALSKRRLAIVEEAVGEEATAAAIGGWEGCHACWPSPSTCKDATDLLLASSSEEPYYRETLTALQASASCDEQDKARLTSALLALPPEVLPEPPPAPKPKPRPAPRPKTKRKRR